ncbi:MAG: DUF192 domain-containing protein [Bacteroidia bacterium]|nr:DUF192 domain-containing protein [Bacteroidia bacterium]
MKKVSKTHTNNRGAVGRYAPLIVIGGILLFLAVIFLVVSQFILPKPGEEAREAMAERKAPAGEIVFRDDAALRFTDASGQNLVEISVEIAESEEARTQGLMGRTRMGERQGMLFLFPNEEYRSFWMANTPLPLDILYVNSALRIVTIRRNTVPFSEESIPSSAPAQYVIEVIAGFCARHGIVEGASVSWTRRGT